MKTQDEKDHTFYLIDMTCDALLHMFSNSLKQLHRLLHNHTTYMNLQALYYIGGQM